ncbi:DUF4440 domain-containing protein [Oscillochloris sp. ZM17-4]|uniref:DUF4440 domain-containing protein n=1 Tax=Oscillochloris sp. ZM17-4 TaxID=2866714 RepID=UPI001C7364F8|nr:DUF4440 domain-containing protein [Oscillochloris sp. ZM17-4]MBX0329298.1 DUF4440 domain-containing protein [Oscillochloris sp. ZM17-4]
MSEPTPAWQTEIVELHAFFVAWLGGALPDDDATFARCAGTMAPGFAIIGPDGRLIAREELLATLRAAHGSRPGLTIWIERPALRYRDGALTLVTYEEWQTEGGRTSGRASTALFRATPGAPNGISWAHVHETWLSGQR